MFLVGTLFHLALHLPCVKRNNTLTHDTEMDFMADDHSEEPVAV